MFRNNAETMSTSTVARQKPRGRGALGAAVALATVPVIAAFIDQQTARALGDHALSIYPANGIDIDPGLLYVVTYSVAGIFFVLWLVAAISSWISRRVALGTAIVVVVLNVAAALTMLFATEYGDQVFPPIWGILVGLPALAGALAIALNIRSRHAEVS